MTITEIREHHKRIKKIEAQYLDFASRISRNALLEYIEGMDFVLARYDEAIAALKACIEPTIQKEEDANEDQKRILFLLGQIDKLEAALREMIRIFGSADLVWTQRKAISDAREALGEK